MTREPRIRLPLVAFALALFLAPAALAGATVASAADGVEVDRDVTDLHSDLRPRDVDRDVADTALVFTNLGNADTRVLCAAFNRNGRMIGRAWTKLPALGVRYMLASDLSGDRDFLGHVQCGAVGAVRGTAIFLGPDLSDFPAEQIDGDAGRIRFPVVATY